MNLLMPSLTLIAATFVSEDLACIAAGLLIQQGRIDVATGILACTFGIFVGDLGLWAAGRLSGRAALGWPWVARRLDGARAQELRAWIERHAAGAIVGSRFLPGSRLPLYVIAGILRVPVALFAVWALLGAVLWTPTIVLLTATLGGAFVAWVSPLVDLGWAARAGGALAVLAAIRAGCALASPRRRVRLRARAARWARWEFWPMWLFYGPVAVWIAWLAIRHRGIATMTAANPGIPDGGTVGESKAGILSHLPPEWTIPFELVGRGEAPRSRWPFPLVLKPDVGQRGTGVKLARCAADVRAYFARAEGAVLVQPFHPGPFEAGVFYYRLPGTPRGRILSITDKQFPFVVGDGESTLEDLIWRHPRCRLQGDTFVDRHRASLGRVPARGERVQLAMAGNHAQGTTFRDGAHLLTPALEQRVDEIAHAFEGFFIGRFDIRYADVEAFKAGRDLAIVELNGATSESTNIYDPGNSLFQAYRQLFRQWSLVFAIGAANRARGARMSTLGRLAALVRAHLESNPAFQVSD